MSWKAQLDAERQILEEAERAYAVPEGHWASVSDEFDLREFIKVQHVRIRALENLREAINERS